MLQKSVRLVYSLTCYRCLLLIVWMYFLVYFYKFTAYITETSKSHHVLVDGHAHHHVFVSAINLQLLMRLWREKQVEIISDFLV